MREKPMEKRENGVRVEHLTGTLPMSEMLEKYVDVEKFLGYCAACPRCGQTWSCPPYDFDPAAVWPQYAAVTLYAVQVFPESEEAKAAAFAAPEMFLRPYRRAFDALLEERERETSARSPRTSWARRSNGGQRTHRRNTSFWSVRC